MREICLSEESKKKTTSTLEFIFEYFINMETRAALDLKVYEQQFLLFIACFKRGATERCIQQ